VELEAIAERLRARESSAWRASFAWTYRLLLLAGLAAAASFSLRTVWAFTIDDAGISYAYAKHLAEGEGPVAAVGGPWVEGYSNPLWVFLLVPLHALGFELPVAAKWLGVGLFGLALAAGSSLIAFAGGRSPRQSGAAEVCFTLSSVLCLELVVWAPAGLENALFGALLLGLAWLDARESATPSAFAASGLAAFALAITRPEGVLYAAPLVAVKLGRAFARREPMRQALTATLLFVLPLMLYHALHYAAFGQLVANTYWAKPPGKTWDQGGEYLIGTLRSSGLVYALPLALLGLYGKPRAKILLAWAVLAGAAFVLYSGGDWMPHGRFVSLFVPALLALAAMGLDHLARSVAWAAARAFGAASRSREAAAALTREAAALILSIAVAIGWFGYQRPRLERVERQGWCHFCERLADAERVQKLGRRAALPSQSLLTHDFGGPAFASEAAFYPLDFLGLCDRSAALLRHTRAPGSVGYDVRFYRYFLHEQPTPPSWVLLPPNFWPLFDRSPEAVLDYYPLGARLLPRARRDSYFVLHRGELVDYFPPLPPAPQRALSERLSLVGFDAFSSAPAPGPGGVAPLERLAPGARIVLSVSVVPRGAVQAGEGVRVRIEAGGEHAESVTVALDRGIEGLARALLPGEPLAVELPLTLPNAAASAYRLSIGVTEAAVGSKQRREKPPDFVAIGELPAGRELGRPERDLPRYPSALPAPLDAELILRRAAVVRAIDANLQNGKPLAEEALADELIASGERLELAGDRVQAYLAYVWATQVRRRAWEKLADTVFQLRPLAVGDEHALELSLLRRYYSSAALRELERLVALYLSLGRVPEAAYLLRRVPEAVQSTETVALLRRTLETELASARAAALVPDSAVLDRLAFDPLGGALDFESDDLANWQGAREAFRAGGPLDGHELPGLRGAHGAGVLSSRASGDRARGALTSPEFRLDGELVSVLVGGGSRKRRVGVELLVDGGVAFSAAGNDSDNLLPVFWEIGQHSGKVAQLRVFDDNPRDHVVVDRLLLWR
jgi:hypothetical protein